MSRAPRTRRARRLMVVALALASAAVAAVGCAADDPDVEPFDEAVRYRDVVELFDQGIARTCSLNNGVCHNSNTYPDLHSINNLIATAHRPCNSGSIDRDEVHDACEPAADRLVIPSMQVDARVLVHVPSPNTAESCTVFWALAISPGFRGPPPAAQVEFAIRVLDEDRQMCELQIPREVPLNPARGGWGVLVMPGDTLATTFQKQFRRWLTAGVNA